MTEKHEKIEGKFTDDFWVVIEVSGRDAQDFLQRTTSQDFRNFQEQELRPGAFLTATGGVIATFVATKLKDTFFLATQKTSQARILQQIEKLHFGENLQYSTSSTTRAIEDSALRILSGKEVDNYVEALKSQGAQKLGLDAWRELKIFNFQPLDQEDLTEANIILEAGLENFVHRNKGCYPGQEVVERIYTYGNIPRKFVQLRGAQEIPAGDIFLEGQKVGRISTLAKDGTTYVANGYLLRIKSAVGLEVEVKGSTGQIASATVTRVSPDLHKEAAT